MLFKRFNITPKYRWLCRYTALSHCPPLTHDGLTMNLLLLSLAGAAGTLARYGVYESCGKLVSRPGWPLPVATLTVNILGSFLFGLIFTLAEQGKLSQNTRWLLLAGFMGAFTTFSSFAFDTGDLITRHQYLAAAANILANNILGITAFFVGLWLAAKLA